MKKQTTFRKTIEKVWKNRAAIVIAIAATVFMCGLTALEFVALRMEWNLPVLREYMPAGSSHSIRHLSLLPPPIANIVSAFLRLVHILKVPSTAEVP